MEARYKKSKGNAGLEGVQFQLDLLIVFLLNAHHTHKNWKISSENQDAGKYDDLVFETPNRNVLLQAKFKQNKKINREQLFSCNSKNADFSLPKYFLSYLEIAGKFKKGTVIICTNTSIDEKGLENALTSHRVNSDSTLHYEDATCTFLTVNKEVLLDLKASAREYLDKNLQGKGIDHAFITDENIESFLENLQIFSKYSSGEALHKIIEKLLFRLAVSNLWRETSYHEIYRKVEDWFQQPCGEYLTEARTKAMLCEIRSDKYCESLKNYNIRFECNDFTVAKSTGIVRVLTNGGGMWPALKIFHTLYGDKCRKLYVNPEESVEVQEEIVAAFGLLRYTYLVIIWTDVRHEVARMRMCQKLKGILEKNPHKKVIFVTKCKDKLVRDFGSINMVNIVLSETFEDLSEESQQKLLHGRSVIFQSVKMSLKELIGNAEPKSFDCTTIEKLIGGAEIKVGVQPSSLERDVACYYIRRKFQRDVEDARQKNTVYTEETILHIAEKVVVISDSAGMGKNTVLTNMAVCIKERYPDFWVIRLNLNDYTNFLRNSLRNKKTITLIELLNSREDTRLSTRFETLIFSMDEKVVLMFDGVDEISPDYTGLILLLLSRSRDALNIKKIFVTTRPHMARELRTTLKVDLFKMLPFTRSNQIDFLTKYWSYNLPPNAIDEGTIEWYAEDLIDEMSLWVQLYSHANRPSENPFAEIPLQLRMMAEIFQDKCEEYLKGNILRTKFLEGANVVGLYEMFIRKKRDVFLDKGNPSGNTAADQALVNQFEECLAWHRSFAAQMVLNDSATDSLKVRIGTKTVENLILKMGIVQRLGDSFQFVHKTFAEYFVAEFIAKGLQLRCLDVKFQRFLIDVMLQDTKYGMVCDFLDSLLQRVVHSLSSEVFRDYYATSSDGFNRGCLIFELAKGGWVAILRLVLKSVGFKIVQGKKISVKYLKRRKNVNALNDLQFLVRRAGVNVTNECGDTPLHYATENAHLPMTRFLVEQGADVNIRHSLGNTPLHMATIFSFTDIVKCLVEHAADINPVDCDVRNNKGETALYIAVESNDFSAVKYLVEHGANVTVSDYTGRSPLHVAVHEWNAEIIEYLITHGADLNARDGKGRTPLHLAVSKCELDVVAYLVGRGANVNIGDRKGRTPLQIAAMGCKSEVVEYLVACGADCNVTNKDGHTALHLAALAGGSEVVKRTIELDVVADINES